MKNILIKKWLNLLRKIRKIFKLTKRMIIIIRRLIKNCLRKIRSIWWYLTKIK